MTLSKYKNIARFFKLLKKDIDPLEISAERLKVCRNFLDTNKEEISKSLKINIKDIEKYEAFDVKFKK